MIYRNPPIAFVWYNDNIDSDSNGGTVMKHDPIKNNGIVKVLVGFLCVAGGILAAGIGAIGVMAARNSKKMKQHENENNYMMSCLFQKEEIELKPDTQNAYITILCSVAHITVPKPDNDHMNLELISFAGNVTIDIPEGVTVRCDGSKYADFSKDGSESSPVIDLVINDCATALTLNFV